MLLIPQTDDMDLYLSHSEIIDYLASEIQEKALILSEIGYNRIELVKNVYEFVRDDISHSMDINEYTVTYQASDVLKYGHGLCIAKSHLLAAILRYLKVPTGFCYQKIRLQDKFIIHGLNAVYLGGDIGWIRLDARGNREGSVNRERINAQFSVHHEILAYNPRERGEVDYPWIYTQPP